MTMTGRRSWISLHVIERPATSRLPIVSKYPGAKLLNRRSGACALPGRHAFHLDRVAVVLAVHRDGRRETNGGDAWHMSQPFRDALERARRVLGHR